MKRVYVFALALAVFAYMPVKATIINIPDDYATIQEGIDASSDGDTVLVHPGTYVENINFWEPDIVHDIVLGSLFLITGDTSYISSTIIDGDLTGTVIIIESGQGSTTVVTGFTIQNGFGPYAGGISCYGSSPIISFNIISNNSSESNGGGIDCYGSNPRIISNTITGNSAQHGGGIACTGYSNPVVRDNVILMNSAYHPSGHGGGIYCYGGNATISNNIIGWNTASGWADGLGGGICCNNANTLIINNTIIHNSARYGGGMAVINGSNVIVANTIFWVDYAPYGSEITFDDISWLRITYCDIEGGWEGEGNIDVYPLFRDPDNGDFHLMSTECWDSLDSPCIDAGDPTIFDSIIDCDWGLGDERSDMGAYGGAVEIPTDIETDEAGLPAQFALSQNYPNPFNASTIIQYSLLEASQVKIEIYDILGRRVETLIQEEQPAGYHQITWDAKDQSSGMYFYRIQAGEYSETRKMVLLR